MVTSSLYLFRKKKTMLHSSPSPAIEPHQEMGVHWLRTTVCLTRICCAVARYIWIN